jgi:DNA-binding transcriptional LysR family regulator
MDCGSLSASARQLHIAQPTVSRLILRIEDQLGVRLFSRVKGRLVPTLEAIRFLEEIDRAFEAMRTAIDRGAQAAMPGRTVFRCGASPSVGRNLVPQAIARVLADDPHATLQLDILSVNQIIPYLLDDSADAAVTLFPILHQQITSKRIGHGRPVLVMPRDMNSMPWDVSSASSLSKVDWIVFQPRSVHGDMLAALLEDIGVRPQRTHLVRFAETAVALVEQGLGVCIVDEFSARAVDQSRVRCSFLETPRRYEVHLHTIISNGKFKVFEHFETSLAQSMHMA